MRTKPAKSKNTKASATKVVKDIRRATRKLYSAEEKIRIVLEGLAVRTVLPSFVAVRVKSPKATGQRLLRKGTSRFLSFQVS